jgi:hypothetical protein
LLGFFIRTSRGRAGALVGWDGCEVHAPFVCSSVRVSRVCPGSPRCAFTDPAQRHTRLKRATNHTRMGCRVCRVNVHAPHRRVNRDYCQRPTPTPLAKSAALQTCPMFSTCRRCRGVMVFHCRI